MTKLSSPLSTRLRDLLVRSGGAPSEDDVRRLVEETGASSADLTRALDELKGGFGASDGAHEQALRRVVADFAFSLSNPTGVRGKRAHEVLRDNQGRRPWYAAVKAELPAPMKSGPARDVTVQGETITSAELQAMLRSLAR